MKNESLHSTHPGKPNNFVSQSVTSPAFALTSLSVGVKEGDWIEYNINITGTVTPPTHDVTLDATQPSEVEGTAFSINVTAWIC